MSDNNQVQEAAPVAANPPQAAAVPPAPKTFTQRFQEIERTVYQMQYVLQFHSQILQNMLSDIKELKEGVGAIKEVTNPNMKLAAEQVWGTQDAIAAKVTQLQAEAYRKVVEQDLADNKIRSIDALKDPRDLVVFTTPDVLYGYQLLETFKDEQVRSDLMGKKVGDKVGDMTLLGIFEEVVAVPAAEPTHGVNDAQTQDSTQTPQ